MEYQCTAYMLLFRQNDPAVGLSRGSDVIFLFSGFCSEGCTVTLMGSQAGQAADTIKYLCVRNIPTQKHFKSFQVILCGVMSHWFNDCSMFLTHPLCFMLAGLSMRTASLIFRSVSWLLLGMTILWNSACFGPLVLGLRTTCSRAQEGPGLVKM